MKKVDTFLRVCYVLFWIGLLIAWFLIWGFIGRVVFSG